MEYVHLSKCKVMTTTVDQTTVDHIVNHPKVFSDAVRLSNSTRLDARTPSRHKAHLTEDQLYYFGDGSTWDRIRAFFLNLVTLFIPYLMHGEGMDDAIEQAQHRSILLAHAGLDDPNESDRFNALHHMPPGELYKLMQVVSNLNQQCRMLTKPLSLEENEQVTLYQLPLGEDEHAPAYEIIANREGIWLQKMNDIDRREFSPVKIMSLQTYNATATINKIMERLNPATRMAFQPYLALEEFYNIDEETPIVSGDLAGNTASMILLGIQAGRVSLTEEGLRLLPIMMNMELNAPELWDLNKVEDQQNLADCIVCHKGPPLIFMGEVADKDDPIKTKLKDSGVFFVGATAKNIGSVKEATKTYSTKEADLCCNAVYDEGTNTLFLPHGIALNSQGDIETAFGPCVMTNQKFDPEAFMVWLNSQNLPKLNTNEYDSFINFAPSGDAIYRAANKLGVSIAFIRDDIETSKSGNVLVIHPWKREKLLFVEAARMPRPVEAARLGKLETLSIASTPDPVEISNSMTTYSSFFVDEDSYVLNNRSNEGEKGSNEEMEGNDTDTRSETV